MNGDATALGPLFGPSALSVKKSHPHKRRASPPTTPRSSRATRQRVPEEVSVSLAAVSAAVAAGEVRAAIYPLAQISFWAWKEAFVQQLLAVAAAWEREAKEARSLNAKGRLRKAAQSLRRRAVAFRECGTLCSVRECDVCGEARPGSGVVSPGAEPCQMRMCGWCARRRSRELVAELVARIQAIRPREKWGWKFLTVQAAYDPTDAGDVSVEGLLSRVQGLKQALRFAWDPDRVYRERGVSRPRGEKGFLGWRLGQKGAGLFVALELAGTGFVHAHLLYFGPYIAKSWLEEALKEGDARCGHTWIAEVREGEEKDAVVEVAKYCAKLVSFLDEDWLRGEERKVLNPELAANYEAAVMGVHLAERYGCLRGPYEPVEVEEAQADLHQVEREEFDHDIECPSCRAKGKWRWGTRELSAWVAECHAKGEAALYGSGWKGRAGGAGGG